MATFRLWLILIVVILKVMKEQKMGWFGNKSVPPPTTPAVTPAVDPGAIPDPSATVAPATTAASFPTAAPENPEPGTVYPVQATTAGDVTKFPRTLRGWRLSIWDGFQDSRRKTSWRERIFLLMQLVTIWGIGYLHYSAGSPMVYMTVGGLMALILGTSVITFGVVMLYFKYWVSDQKAAEFFGGDRLLPALIQLAIIGLAIWQMANVLRR